MKQTFDVVIIGAGPAGLQCADTLSRNNKMRILLLEKNPVIGPKCCAGGLTSCDMKHMKVPDTIVDYALNEVRVATPAGDTVAAFDRPVLFSVTREKLGSWQLKKIRNSGKVTIRTRACVTDIHDDYVTVNRNERIHYHYLVGADGSSSVVRRYVRLPIRQQGIAMHYRIPANVASPLAFFLHSVYFGPWYAWQFPHKSYNSVGCVFDPLTTSAAQARHYFRSWLDENSMETGTAFFEGAPINTDYQGYRFGYVFLAGDAAGLASPLTGKGICQAYVSGEEIAREILDDSYTSPVISQISAKHKAQTRIAGFIKKSGRLQTAGHAVLLRALGYRTIREYLLRVLE